MHVATWHRQTSESKFTKFEEKMSIGKTPNHAKFCDNATKSVWDIRNQKFVLPEKVGQNSPKLLKTCYPIKPPIMPNFIETGETTSDKALQNFFHLSIFWLHRGTPGPKVTGLVVAYINPPIATCKISSRSDNPSSRYLLPNFVDFVAGVTHKNTKHKKTYGKWYVSALHAATTKLHAHQNYQTQVKHRWQTERCSEWCHFR